MAQMIRIDKRDNVAVAVEPLESGQEVLIDGLSLQAREGIPFGHKMALTSIAAGESIVKYGFPIGHATSAIQPGQWVHLHNMATNLDGRVQYTYNPQPYGAAALDPALEKTFWGYQREDGSCATRNQVWVIPTVSCVNELAEQIAREADKRYPGACDGFVALPHNAGCSQLGDDFDTTQRILRGLVAHPNAGGVLLVSLGCENNDFGHFLPCLEGLKPGRIRTMVAQEETGSELERGLELVVELLAPMGQEHRVELPLQKLTIGMKCGASDAISGITANPLCGSISDIAAAMGGSVVMTEVPEMFGAETLLMDRAENEKVFGDVVELIDQFKDYYLQHDQPIYENPSPGNKEGGITTLEEKSIGCVQKGGRAPVTGTLAYGEQCRRAGLNLLIGPGNDSVSLTDLLASGAQIILFTTGRGNPLGTVAPTLKISSSDALWKRKPGWIDFNAGVLLDGFSREKAAVQLWNLLAETASGKQLAKNEQNHYRQVMIFKNGVLL